MSKRFVKRYISELIMMENENQFSPKVVRPICMNQKMDGRAAWKAFIFNTGDLTNL